MGFGARVETKRAGRQVRGALFVLKGGRAVDSPQGVGRRFGAPLFIFYFIRWAWEKMGCRVLPLSYLKGAAQGGIQVLVSEARGGSAAVTVEVLGMQERRRKRGLQQMRL